MLLLSDRRKIHGKHVPLASIRHTDFLEVALKLHWVDQSVLSETWWRKVSMTAQSVQCVPTVQFRVGAETSRHS
jgi:hypothetical protein